MHIYYAMPHWSRPLGHFKDGVVMFCHGLELAAMATHSRAPVMVGAKPEVFHSGD